MNLANKQRIPVPLLIYFMCKPILSFLSKEKQPHITRNKMNGGI